MTGEPRILPFPEQAAAGLSHCSKDRLHLGFLANRKKRGRNAGGNSKCLAPAQLTWPSIVDERGVVEINRRKLILFSPVVLAVLPFRLVAALGQQVHVAHQIAGIEILRIDP